MDEIIKKVTKNKSEQFRVVDAGSRTKPNWFVLIVIDID